jgi:sec1 family domain-containing protein 1
MRQLSAPSTLWPKVSPCEVDSLELSVIAAGVWQVLLCCGTVPIIACPSTSGPSRFIANALSSLMADPTTKESLASLAPVRRAFARASSTAPERPLLVLLDRTIDIAASLAHPSTYSALVGETLKTFSEGTRVRLPASPDGSQPATSMDLDADSDHFWAKAAHLPFPEAVEMQGAW